MEIVPVATKQTAENETTNLPAVPYGPTAEEKRAVASYERRKAVVPPTPSIVCKLTDADEKGNRAAQLNVDHPNTRAGHQMISDAIGSGDMTFTYGLLLDASSIAAQADGCPRSSA